MNLLIEQLRDDHKHLVRILYHLEKEVKAISGLLKTDIPSIETVLDILDYIQVYPEIWHHPTEDVIFEILLQKEIPEAQLLADAMEEHGVLEMLTENLHQHLNMAVAGSDFSPARFIKSTNDYINRQLRHMEFEQKHLFTLAEQYLQAEDWDAIKERLKDQQHLLDEPRLQEYSSFHNSIANSCAVTAH